MLRTLLFVFLLLPLGLSVTTASAQTQAERLERHNYNQLARISNLLNRTETLEAPFTQYNADGSVSSGTLYMKRPGRLRMEYSQSTDPLIIVGANSVNIYDGERDKRPEVYPLKRTPLWHLLKPHVNLTTREGITRTWTQDGYFWMTAFDTDTPEAGTVHFYFNPDNLELQGWWSSTEEGPVHVKLGQLRSGGSYSSFLFSANHETDRRNRR